MSMVDSRLLVEAQAEIETLRDLLRWRKWPEEKPMVNEDTHFQVLYTNSKFPGHEIFFLFNDGPSFNREDISYWRPIGPLPGEGGE